VRVKGPATKSQRLNPGQRSVGQSRDGGPKSRVKVTPGSKVNGSLTPEFRTVVNVFDPALQRDAMLIGGLPITDRHNVMLDSESLQSNTAITDNSRRAFTNKPHRRTNGLLQPANADKLANSKGLYFVNSCS